MLSPLKVLCEVLSFPEWKHFHRILVKEHIIGNYLFISLDVAAAFRQRNVTPKEKIKNHWVLFIMNYFSL
jgi:hypothetical protein